MLCTQLLFTTDQARRLVHDKMWEILQDRACVENLPFYREHTTFQLNCVVPPGNQCMKKGGFSHQQQSSHILSQSKPKAVGQTLALTQASKALLSSVGIKSRTLVFQCLTTVLLQDFNNLIFHSFSRKGLLLF